MVGMGNHSFDFGFLGGGSTVGYGAGAFNSAEVKMTLNDWAVLSVVFSAGIMVGGLITNIIWAWSFLRERKRNGKRKTKTKPG